MHHPNLRVTAVLLSAAALLAACGSGGGGGDGGSNQGTGDVPSSAQQSVSGLIAFMKDLISNQTNETSEPIALGTAVLPTDDTSEPASVN